MSCGAVVWNWPGLWAQGCLDVMAHLGSFLLLDPLFWTAISVVNHEGSPDI